MTSMTNIDNLAKLRISDTTEMVTTAFEDVEVFAVFRIMKWTEQGQTFTSFGKGGVSQPFQEGVTHYFLVGHRSGGWEFLNRLEIKKLQKFCWELCNGLTAMKVKYAKTEDVELVMRMYGMYKETRSAHEIGETYRGQIVIDRELLFGVSEANHRNQ